MMLRYLAVIAVIAFMAASIDPVLAKDVICSPWSGDSCEPVQTKSYWSVAVFRQGETEPRNWPYGEDTSVDEIGNQICNAITSPWDTPIIRVEITNTETGDTADFTCP